MMNGTGRGCISENRRLRAPGWFSLVTVLVLIAAACGSSGDTSGSSSGSTALSGTAKDWPVYAHDLANTRFNPNEHKITAATAHKLTKAWSKEGIKGVSGTPAVVGERAGR